MSLDVYLTKPNDEIMAMKCIIFVKKNGETRECYRWEWDEIHPDAEPITMPAEPDEVYWANITHNLVSMATEAGIYQCLWRPEEMGITKAAQLIEPLQAGITLMKREPERFKAFNPPNGWGSYDGFVPWVENYLQACREYPEADVGVSR